MGGIAGWWIHATMSAPRSVLAPAIDRPGSVDAPGIVDTPRSVDAPRTARTGPATAPSSSEPLPPDEPHIGIEPIAVLRKHSLRLPVDGANVNTMKGGFTERRGGGARGHEAVDILAPRSTPVHAVEDGKIAKLFFSKAGGITIYQFDPTGQFCYYYAHLDRYAPGLREGQAVSSGDVIGYVGTTGNAPANTPHLHFAIFQLTDQKRWWDGIPIDPYQVFEH